MQQLQNLLNFFTNIWAWFKSVISDIYNFIVSIIEFFFDLIKWVIDTVFSFVVDFLVWLLGIIPDPCCIQGTLDALQWLSQFLHSNSPVAQWLAYIFSLFQFGYGLGVILCAALARFILRRLPFIG